MVEMECQVEKIEKLQEELNKIANELYKNNTHIAYNSFAKIMPKLNQTIIRLIGQLEEFKNYDIDLPKNVIIAQLNNMVEAFENRDTIMLADTIVYELNNTLSVYQEIIQELASIGVTLE